MISCTEFIPLYSELFQYLDDHYGHDAVIRYWEYISDTYVADLLGKEVASKGLRGCWDYWAKSLNEEACDFRMELDVQEGTFSIDMRSCPSRGRLNSYSHMEPYYDYCGHCALLYARQLQKYGIVSQCLDMSRVSQGKCYLKYRLTGGAVPKDRKPEKLVMDVRAADNEYFHRDFHISGDRGLRYVGENYGNDAVMRYLTVFAQHYYLPLIEAIKKAGLSALKDHIEEIYRLEKAPEAVHCTLTEHALLVTVSHCPAVAYMKDSGYEPSKWYREATAAVSRAIAEAAALRFALLHYDEATGAAEYRFYR